jgi:hypothetical protein
MKAKKCGTCIWKKHKKMWCNLNSEIIYKNQDVCEDYTHEDKSVSIDEYMNVNPELMDN